MAWFTPSRRTEATPQQRVATGATGSGGYDPIDKDYGYRSMGGSPREIPARTRDQARNDSIAGYRANPMARAIIDTYVAFCVGDAGLTLQCTSDVVRPYVEAFWTDPKNRLAAGQELMLRSALLNGEALNEMMVGDVAGIVRRSPIDPVRIHDVTLLAGNPLWPQSVVIRNPAGAADFELSLVDVDDSTGLLTGDAMFWPMFQALETDQRGAPFLMPVLDWLDSYDRVLSNLIDRTALARFIAMDVTLKGPDADVEGFVAQRGGLQIPRSGTIEVHNESVEWNTMKVETGAEEDTTTNKAVMTVVAAGSGLSKTWLAEPEDANRATSLTMAEPVRRRIGSVQNVWLANMTAMCRFAVDRLVAAGTLPRMVTVSGPGDTPIEVEASSTVSVTGPQIAAADAQVTAGVLQQLSEGLAGFVEAGIMSPDAAKEAAKKAWTDFVGVPYRAELDDPDASADDVATAIDDAGGSSAMNALQNAA
jgi:hypothetical protein